MTASHTVADLLHQELHVLNSLLSLLQEEQAQLLSASIEQLDELLPQKSGVVSQLAELSNKRYDTLLAAGYSRDEAGMKDWILSIAATPNGFQVEKEWRELMALTQTAKELNRINGMLITSHLQRTQQTLNTLCGNNHQSVYGRDGQQHTQFTKVRSVVAG